MKNKWKSPIIIDLRALTFNEWAMVFATIGFVLWILSRIFIGVRPNA